MLAISLADLRFRARQFLIAIIGLSLIMAVALLLSGLVSGFNQEISQTVDGVGADAWILSNSASGRITAFAAFSQLEVATVRAEPGVRKADPLLLVPSQVARIGDQSTTVNLLRPIE